ncbi:MAG: hypothetical protein C5S41_08975 [Candidatus Methanomarinus sp.]|nr:MAG: hypothetical protein C5S41_08975 [ANME-2 cluster archaeon]
MNLEEHLKKKGTENEITRLIMLFSKQGGVIRDEFISSR